MAVQLQSVPLKEFRNSVNILVKLLNIGPPGTGISTVNCCPFSYREFTWNLSNSLLWTLGSV